MTAFYARIFFGCLASPVAGCSGPNHESGDAGHVPNVYNWSDFIDPSVLAGFEKETGIKVRYDVYESNEMMEVKLLAGHADYDVVVPGGRLSKA